MCDHLSYALLNSGVNTLKLYLFGPVKEVFPYLLRRVEENKGFLSRTVRERELLTAEVKRRKIEK